MLQQEQMKQQQLQQQQQLRQEQLRQMEGSNRQRQGKERQEPRSGHWGPGTQLSDQAKLDAKRARQLQYKADLDRQKALQKGVEPSNPAIAGYSWI